MFKNEINKQDDDLNAAKMLLRLGNIQEKEKSVILNKKILKPHPKFRVNVLIGFLTQ